MNKRIQQLAEQAGFSNNFSFSENGFEVAFVDEEHTTKCLAKFAELLVQECCDVLYDNEQGGYQVNYTLKEHFGVK